MHRERASASLVSGSLFLSSFFVSFSAMEKERRKKRNPFPLDKFINLRKIPFNLYF
jgi:hypothetical protein